MLYPTNNATLQILHPYLDKVVEKVEVQKGSITHRLSSAGIGWNLLPVLGSTIIGISNHYYRY